MNEQANGQQWVKVWDPFVRIFHWSLAVLFVVAYFTGGEESWIHEWSGYGLLVLVVTRILWGFVGTKHARFSDFVRSPAAALGYLRDLATGQARRYLGHNPAGGWMTLLLLVAVLATSASGVIVLGLEGEGPLANRIGAQSWIVSVAATFGAGEAEGEGGAESEGGAEGEEEAEGEDEAEHEEQEEEHGGEREAAGGATGGAAGGDGGGLEAAEEAWEEWHELLANFTVFLVIVHILGVLASSLAHRENLPRAMITGRKRAE